MAKWVAYKQSTDSDAGFEGRLAELQKFMKRLIADSYVLLVELAMP